MFPYADTALPDLDAAIDEIKTILELDAPVSNAVDAVFRDVDPAVKPDTANSWVWVVVREPTRGDKSVPFTLPVAEDVQIMCETHKVAPDDNPGERLRIVHNLIRAALCGQKPTGHRLPIALQSRASAVIYDPDDETYFSTAVYRLTLE